MTIETYPEMNTKVVDILRWTRDNPTTLYAAQRIEELEAEVERLQRELHDEQVRRNEWEKMYNQAIKTEEETGDDTQIMLQAPRRGVWRTAERTAVGGRLVDHRQ